VTPVQHNPAILPPGAGESLAPRTGGATAPAQGPAFKDLLAEKVGGVTFSRHAAERLQRRGIDLSSQTLSRLEGGVSKAAAKGSRESVVFVDGTAFVVSVRNNTVITAVDSGHMKDHVFTNIDSAVIA
jgi:flagellar operon protein